MSKNQTMTDRNGIIILSKEVGKPLIIMRKEHKKSYCATSSFPEGESFILRCFFLIALCIV